MWTLGIATAVIGAAIALLLAFYLRLSAGEDAPEAATAKPSTGLKPFRRPETARVPLGAKRSLPVRVAPERESVILILPDGAGPLVASASGDNALEEAVPVLEAVLTGHADEGRPVPALSVTGGAPIVSSAHSI